MAVILNFEFKGARNYIQGGDFVNRVDAYLRKNDLGRLIRVVFRSFTRNQCELHLSMPPAGLHVIADGRFAKADGSIHPFWLVETVEPVIGRNDYNEELITAQARIDGNRVSMESPTPFTLIENVIAITKMLSYRLTPDVDGKWVFGQLSLIEPLPDSHERIVVEQKASLAGKFSNNAMHVDDRYIGDMRFIVGKS